MIFGILSVVIPLVLAILGFTWWLSGRLATQDVWLSEIKRRLGNIEKHLGMSMDNEPKDYV